jgi:hypothetical protein
LERFKPISDLPKELILSIRHYKKKRRDWE